MSVAVNQVVFTTGGTVQAGGGTYLPRRADGDLLALCRQSQFAYVLTARQMGKSSLMVRTVEQLARENVRAVMIDLTQIGTQVTPEQWYLGLLAIIEDQLMLDTGAVAWWQANAHLGFTQRLTNFFHEALLKEVTEPVVIFVDEIDTTLSLEFTDDFYAAIRYLYNARATTPEFKRLSFVLIGVATPGDLIRDPQRTPFNIGQRVDLADFTADEALPLATGLSLPPDESAQALGWMMKWTNGHPYLTQRLCLALVDQRRPHWTEADVDGVVANTFFGAMSEQDNNLSFVRDMLTKRAPDVESVLTTYQEVRSGKRPVRDEAQSIVKSHLKLSGIVRRKGVELRSRNRIYETVFDERWVRKHLPVNWRKRFKYAAAGLIAAIFILSLPMAIYAFNQSRKLQKALDEVSKSRDSAMKAREAEASQRTLAEANAIEAESQRRIAEDARQAAEQASSRAEASATLAQVNALEAGRQRGFAHSRELAANSISQSTIDPNLSLRLAIEARRVAPTSQAEDALRQVLLESRIDVVMRGHAGPVLNAAYSPDGKYIVTASNDHTVRVWDAGTGRSIRELRGHLGNVLSAAYSSDGKFIVTASADKTARVWDASNGQRIREFKGHTDSVLSAAYSPDGKYILTTSSDKTARVWDANTGQRLRELRSSASKVLSAAYSPDGKLIVSAADGLVTFWDASTGQQVSAAAFRTDSTGPPPIQPYFTSVAYSPSGLHIVAAKSDGTAEILDSSGRSIGGLKGHTDSVLSATYSPDGRFIVTTSNDKTARVWDAYTEKSILDLKSHTDKFSKAAFSPDGRFIVTASDDGTACVWLNGGGPPITELKGRSAPILSAAYSPDNKLIITTDVAAAYVWDSITGKLLGELGGHAENGNDMLLKSAAYSQDGRFILTAAGRTLRIWDAARIGYRPARILSRDEVKPIDGVKPIGEMRDPLSIESAAYSPDGKFIVTASADHTVRVWDALTTRLVAELKGHSAPVNSAAYSPDGKFIVTASSDSTARIWNASTAQPISTLKGYKASYSPDGKFIVTTSGDGTAQVWNASTAQLLAELKSHPGAVNGATYSPDSKFIVTAGTAQTSRIWDASTHQPVAELKGHSGAVANVAYSPDGRFIVTASYDRTARIYPRVMFVPFAEVMELARKLSPRQLTPEERERHLHEPRSKRTPTALR